jgi:O-antigen ligase
LVEQSNKVTAPLWFKIIIWSFPLWWLALYLYSYAAEFFHNPHMGPNHPGGLSFTLLYCVPPIVMLVLIAINPWFRQKLLIMVLIWVIAPFSLLSLMGLTQGALSSAFTRALSETKSQTEYLDKHKHERDKETHN